MLEIRHELIKGAKMLTMFNSVLADAGIPASDVRLLRHKDNSAKKGRTPYELWLNNRPQFELYQSTQNILNHKKLKAPFWAVFIATPNKETMFAGLYAVQYRGLLEQDTPMPHKDGIDKAGSIDTYFLALQEEMKPFIGKLFISWGPGTLAWIQYASRHDKPIIRNESGT